MVFKKNGIYPFLRKKEKSKETKLELLDENLVLI